MRRCYNKNCKDFKNWGGRGIKVYKPWHDASVFLKYILKTIGRRPSSKHSLDRYPDNDGAYKPGNVRWATARQQRHNQRKTK